MFNPFRRKPCEALDELERLEKRRDSLVGEMERLDQIATDAMQQSVEHGAMIGALDLAIAELRTYTAGYIIERPALSVLLANVSASD